MWSPRHPFRDYLVHRYCPENDRPAVSHECGEDYLRFSPFYATVFLSETSEGDYVAKVGSSNQTLDDVLSRWGRHIFLKDGPPHYKGIRLDQDLELSNIQGNLGEMVLALVMESMLEEAAKGLSDNVQHGVVWGRNQDVMDWNDLYAMVHNGPTSVQIRERKDRSETERNYKRLIKSDPLSEHDAIGFLENSNSHYMLIGEAKTSPSKTEYPVSLGLVPFKETAQYASLKALQQEMFPDRKLIYAVMADENWIRYSKSSGFRLSGPAIDVYEGLQELEIDAIFIPLPSIRYSLSIQDAARVIQGQEIEQLDLPFLK